MMMKSRRMNSAAGTQNPAQAGEGAAADPESPSAFTGEFAESECVGWASGLETGFSFDTNRLTAEGFYAQVGRQENGVFLE